MIWVMWPLRPHAEYRHCTPDNPAFYQVDDWRFSSVDSERKVYIIKESYEFVRPACLHHAQAVNVCQFIGRLGGNWTESCRRLAVLRSRLS